MALLGLTGKYIWTALPLTGFCVGAWLDAKETERHTMFRDKSALYKRKMCDDPPSW